MHFKNDKVFLPIGKNASSAITLSFLGVDCVATKGAVCFSAHGFGCALFYFAQEMALWGNSPTRRLRQVADFEKMYYELFNGITDIIEDLKKLQQKAEESYIEAKEENN